MKKEFIEIGNKIILVDWYEVKPMTKEIKVLANESEYKPLIDWAPAIINRILGDVIADPFTPNTFQTLECGGIFIISVSEQENCIIFERSALKVFTQDL